MTGADGVSPAANVDVDVYQFDAALGGWEWVSGDTTTAAGAYSAAGLVTGNYRLHFSDPTYFFVAEYYDNKPDLEIADDVPVQLGVTTAGINASLAASAETPTPTATRTPTPTATGALATETPTATPTATHTATPTSTATPSTGARPVFLPLILRG